MRPHRAIRTVKTKARPFGGKCEKCGKAICLSCAYSYTDDTSAAINNASPYLCRECYEERHGKQRTAVDEYKEELASMLLRVKEHKEMVAIDDLLEYIRAHS